MYSFLLFPSSARLATRISPRRFCLFYITYDEYKKSNLILLSLSVDSGAQALCSWCFDYPRWYKTWYPHSFLLELNMLSLVIFIAFYRVLYDHVRLWTFLGFADLRDDKQFFIDHPGAVPITTNQVLDSCNMVYMVVISLRHDDHFVMKHGSIVVNAGRGTEETDWLCCLHWM